MSYKITDEQKNRVKMSSIFALPTSPSERGMKPDAIKEAFWKPFSILIELINNCFDEIVKLASSKPTVWIEQNFGLAVGMVMYCYKELKFGDIILISEAGVPDFIIIKAEKPYVDEETIHITEEEVCNNQLPVPKPGEIYRIGNTELALLGVESGIASVEYDEKFDKNSTNAIQNKAVAELAERIQKRFESIKKTYCTIEDFNEIESLAKGANQALSFGNYEEFIHEFNYSPNDEYKCGQNIYIRKLNVPDLWVSRIYDYAAEYTYRTDEDFIRSLTAHEEVQVGYYAVSALETQKVDLTEYATLEDLENVAGHVDNGLKAFEQYADGKYAVKLSEAIDCLYGFDSNGEPKACKITESIFVGSQEIPTSDAVYQEAYNRMVEILNIVTDGFVSKDELGNIETALDSIIAIQNSLIGGDSV